MNMGKVSKAIAGAVVGLAVTWVSALWGFEVPAETITWVEGVVASVVSSAIGYALVYISPKNTE